MVWYGLLFLQRKGHEYIRNSPSVQLPAQFPTTEHKKQQDGKESQCSGENKSTSTPSSQTLSVIADYPSQSQRCFAPCYAIIGHFDIVMCRGRRSSEESAVPLLLSHDRVLSILCSRGCCCWLLSLIALIIGNNSVDGHLEYLVNADHLLATALHISRAHLLSNRHTLLLGNRSQALGLEEVNACSFCP